MRNQPRRYTVVDRHARAVGQAPARRVGAEFGQHRLHDGEAVLYRSAALDQSEPPKQHFRVEVLALL